MRSRRHAGHEGSRPGQHIRGWHTAGALDGRGGVYGGRSFLQLMKSVHLSKSARVILSMQIYLPNFTFSFLSLIDFFNCLQLVNLTQKQYGL